MMETKSDTVRRLVANRRYKEALRIAKDFHLGISRADLDDMKTGYECIVHERFYKSLGYDTENKIDKAICTIMRIYG